jgi:hypothetical protein
MKLASCHSSGIQNSEVDLGFLEKFVHSYIFQLQIPSLKEHIITTQEYY